MSNSKERVTRRQFLRTTSAVAGAAVLNAVALNPSAANAQSVAATVGVDATTRYQTIDGFGTTAGTARH